VTFVVPPSARSWVPVPEGSDFPIQNLPFGLAAPKGRSETVVVAIGDHALDLSVLAEAGLLDAEEFPILDCFLELDSGSLRRLRQEVFQLLEADNPALRDQPGVRGRALVPIAEANLQVPIQPGSFVDFYSGIHHASNVGKMFRPDQPPLLPNYRWLPIAYNGRANTVVPSGTPIVRPKGQTKAADAASPAFEPTAELDFELEMGCFVSHGQEHGKRITATAAEEHLLGLVIVNDWSARDFQRWEYQPLGPFLAKSFATSVSPWIVTLDALEPFRTEGQAQDPPPLPHLRVRGKPHFDIHLEVWITPAGSEQGVRVCRTNMGELYWSLSQQVAHMTSNGAPIEFGDLFATGTISGEEPGTYGSLLELSWRGSRPVDVGSGQTRTFLQDGDTVTMRAYGERGGLRVGFGECSGTVVPAL
jgi:fumarylacetoacetase